jgi:predicted Na+-dependent transporter
LRALPRWICAIIRIVFIAVTALVIVAEITATAIGIVIIVYLRVTAIVVHGIEQHVSHEKRCAVRLVYNHSCGLAICINNFMGLAWVMGSALKTHKSQTQQKNNSIHNF